MGGIRSLFPPLNRHREIGMRKVTDPEVKLLEVYTITRTAENTEPSPGIVVVLGAKGHITAELSNF